MAAVRGRNARRGGEARGVFLCAPGRRNERLEEARRAKKRLVFRQRLDLAPVG
jgi:hypothetical protein